MGEKPDSSYVIRTGAEALDRLDLIARLLWPTTQMFLARVAALNATRFLDVGCGIGDVACRIAATGVASTGIDPNEAVVRAAKERCVRHGSTAAFRVGGLAELGTDPDLAGFDVVYARCVISHLSDAADALRSMRVAVKPGGLILVEDVEVDAVWSSPPCAPLARHAQLYVAAAKGLGARPDVAPHLAGLLRAMGATDTTVDVVQPVLQRPSDLQIHARTMEAIAEPVITQGLATEEEVIDLVTQLDEWAETPGVVATLPRIVQVSARTPVEIS